jgi:hypothetical protein
MGLFFSSHPGDKELSMKPVIPPSMVFAVLVLVGPCIALAQTSGPSAFTKKKFDSDSVPALQSGNATATYPSAASSPGSHVTWPSCSKQTALIAELEKTVALQVERIKELETAVKVAGKAGAK